MSAVRHSRPGGRLRRRLVAQLFLVSGAVCALMAWASHELVRRTFEEQLAAQLDQRLSRASSSVDGLRAETEMAVAALASFLRQDDPEGLGRLLIGGIGAADEATRLIGRAGMGWLEILDGDGTILSSAAWPEQAGLRHGELLDLPDGSARLLEVATATETVPAFVARRELRVGSRVIHLVGGQLLDPRTLPDLGTGGHWLRVGGSDGDTYSVGASPVGTEILVSGAGGGVHTEVSTDDGGRLLVAAVELPIAGDRKAWLFSAVSRDASARRLRDVGFALMGFAGLAAGLAAVCGVWIARRVTAPVAELVRSVDAIAAGTEDYTFTRSTGDELEELTASFSRLHRSLELQRQRSRAAERVAAWRDVARRVAHEVKNPLAPIRLTIENLVRARRRGKPLFDEMFDEGAGTILEEVERLRRLVGEFSEFARWPLPEPRPTDLTALIDEVTALYRAEPGLEVDVVHGVLPQVRLDPDQVSRALSNVLGNAIEAMRTLPGERPHVVGIRTATEDDHVRVDIEDRGPGLSPEALDKLFEPYFTTKAGGTGLGLAITFRIITEHGGVIAASNRGGGGVRVTMRLPVAGPAIVASSTTGMTGFGEADS